MYGNLFRMDGNRWPKKIYQWTPHGRRRIGGIGRIMEELSDEFHEK